MLSNWEKKEIKEGKGKHYAYVIQNTQKKAEKSLVDLMFLLEHKIIGEEKNICTVTQLQKLINTNKVISKNRYCPYELTTLWDFPIRGIGGESNFPGNCAPQVIENLLNRYITSGQFVVDPMAGSGTTLDVCRSRKIECHCYDLTPYRDDIIENNAIEKIPENECSVDLVFLHPPYRNMKPYSNKKTDLSNTDRFLELLKKVFVNSYKILKVGGILAVLIGEDARSKRIIPDGYNSYKLLLDIGFKPKENIIKVQNKASSHNPLWAYRAVKNGFYFRGFEYIWVVEK